MITLALDAATYVGTVAVFNERRLLADAAVAMKGANEERLMPAVAEVLGRANVPVSNIARVVCGAGPGSFTSLRIAASIAKGIASGVGGELFAVPSLGLIAGAFSTRPGRYAAVLDALRGEQYVGIYEVDAGDVREALPPRVVANDDVPAYAASEGATPIGPAYGGEAPHARYASTLVALLDERGPVDLATWEPDYGRLAEAQAKWEAAHGKRLADA
jgi:tRNA threonylcarbamoyladenosine biosynthesis protein TsaB